jgi:WD40 repeat protein
VAISPDDKRIVSGSSDKTVKVWDTGTGKNLLTLKGHTAAVVCVAFSPVGKRIATGSYDTVKVWDAGTGKSLLTIKGFKGPVFSVAFSPDGKRIVSGSGAGNPFAPGKPGGEVKVWDAQTGQELLSFKGHADPCGIVDRVPFGVFKPEIFFSVLPGVTRFIMRRYLARQSIVAGAAYFVTRSDYDTTYLSTPIFTPRTQKTAKGKKPRVPTVALMYHRHKLPGEAKACSSSEKRF